MWLCIFHHIHLEFFIIFSGKLIGKVKVKYLNKKQFWKHVIREKVVEYPIPWYFYFK